MIENIIYKVNEIIWGLPFLTILTCLGIYITIKLKFPQFATLKSVFKITIKDKSKITTFKSLMNILAGTLGIGNIVGVATAISIGGIGTIFWIFISGFIAMAISYAENYIVLKYRKKNKNGEYSGGAMCVLKEVIGNNPMAIIFCIFTILASLGIGAMVQSSSVLSIIENSYNVNTNVLAVIITGIFTYVIFKGKKLITNINSIVIPACTCIYIALCFMVIFQSPVKIYPAIKNIVNNAFKIKSVIAGGAYIGIFKCISLGFSRGMFSNEAGMGSAPIFSACTEEQKGVENISHIMAYSVFIDTIVLCTLTGLTIVVANTYNVTNIAIMLERTFATMPFGNFLATFCMMLFALATVPCWAFYGEQAIKFLIRGDIWKYLYKVIYILFIYIGCKIKVPVVWDISSIFNACMALPNIYMIYCLRKELNQ